MMKHLKWIVPVALVGLILGNAAGAYNKFVDGDVLVDQEWSQVETQYQRRFDLIPNLVQTVKGVADFEQGTLVAVTEARAAALGAMKQVTQTGDVESFERSNMVFGSALRGLMGYAENYPELKANKSFQDLQVQLEGTENRITTARTRYNEAVASYNRSIRRFPGRLWAAAFGFESRDAFEAASGAESAPRVDFGS